MSRTSVTSRAPGLVLALLLSACATPPETTDQASTVDPNAAAPAPTSHPAAGTPLQLTATPLPGPAVETLSFTQPDAQTGTETASPASLVASGSGQFINRAAAAKPAAVTATAPGAGVTLNFEGASIRDVVKVVFETLKENYVIDPQVQGEVTVQTSRPLAADQLLPTLETLLRMNNAVLVREGGVYRVVPAAGAVRLGNQGARLGGGGVGFGVRIIPLRYVSAAEMQAIIAPFLPEGGVLRADTNRNLLVLAGTATELTGVQSTIDTFDVNWLKGMSIGMFRLRNVDSQAMATQLNQLLGEGSGTPIAGLLRFVPLNKLNAVLVITPQKEYLREVATWIERLDGIGGERLYVYHVQHNRAAYMAELLNGLFNLGGGTGTGRGGEVAPGLKSTQLSSGGGLSGGLSGSSSLGSGTGTSSLSSSASSLGGSSSSVSSSSLGGASGGGFGTGTSTTSGSNRAGGGSGSGVSSIGAGGPSAGMEEVRIVADTDNNSLLIWATAQNYERINSTLEKIDVSPRQVLIEATIAEVTLTGNLQYGLQWFFNNYIGSDQTGYGSLGLTNTLNLTDALKNISSGQFSYAVADTSGKVNALLTALASDSKVKVLSSPQVMVQDNQQAVIQVGTQQPIPSGTTTVNNVTTSGGTTYKDTGVVLDVLPQIHTGGMVNMTIKQLVTDVGPLVDVAQTGSVASKQRSFLQRSVQSKVTVKSGQTLVLGGLIRDNRSDGQNGIPVLYKIPVVGALFGNTTETVDRTELIVLITPRVVQDSQEATQATEEIKRKMQLVVPVLPAS